MSSKLTSFLTEKIKHYSSLLTEADDSFDMSKLGDNDNKEANPETSEPADSEVNDSEENPVDPTKLGSDGDIPDGEDGSFVSDTKLANFASILLQRLLE